MKKLIRGVSGLGLGTLGLLAAGTPDATLVETVDNATAGFSYVQAFVWVVVAFGVTLAIVKWAKRRG